MIPLSSEKACELLTARVMAFKRDLTAVTHRRWLLPLTSLAYLTIGCCSFTQFPVASLIPLVIGVVLLLPSRRWPSDVVRNAAVPRVSKRRVHVEADEHGVLVNGKRVFVPADLAAGYYNGPTRTVRLRPRPWALRRLREFEVTDEGEALELLSALNLAPCQSAATYPLGMCMKLRVGGDGVLVSSFGRRRFISFRDVKGVSQADGRAVIVLASGERLTFSHVDANAIFDRLREELAAFRARAASDMPPPFLERQGRTREEWIRGLRSLLESSNYRTASLATEALWRIVEDPAAEAAVRVGAAIALRASLNDEGRTRLRQAAMGSASPQVRAALEASTESGAC